MESNRKSRQFCSVCKEWLEMEVVPTGDGDDDGVIWYRCPQCQGFLPKLSASENRADDSPASAEARGASAAAVSDAPAVDAEGDLIFDSPAEMMAARRAVEREQAFDLPLDLEAVDLADVIPGEIGEEIGEEIDEETDEEPEPGIGGRDGVSRGRGSKESAAEPVAEYAARLEEALAELPPDAAGGRPYRPWETYDVGQCVQHLAWEDCGIVVGKEKLPGGRQVIKVFFREAGVVRLIEQASQ